MFLEEKIEPAITVTLFKKKKICQILQAERKLTIYFQGGISKYQTSSTPFL